MIAAAARPAEQVALQPLAEVEDEWEALSQRVDAPPFLRPGWFAAYRDAFLAEDEDVDVCVARRQGCLVAALPVVRRRRLVSPSNDHSPFYAPVAADPAAHDAVLAGLLRLAPTDVDLRMLDMDRADLAGLPALAATLGWRCVGRTHRAPVVRLEGAFSDFEKQLSRNRRRGMRRQRRRLEEQGVVAIDFGERGPVDARIDEVLRIEGTGWKGRAGSAIVSRPETARFYRGLAHWADTHGWLRLGFLRLDGRAIACEYALEHRGTLYSLKTGYDDAFAVYGPGMLMLNELCAYAFARGVERIEMLGRADRYKLEWTGGEARTLGRIVMMPPGPVGTARWAALAVAWPAVVRLRQARRERGSDGGADQRDEATMPTRPRVMR